MTSQKVEFPLPWWEGMKGRGIDNLLEFLDSSPSPQPSPVKGEGVFLTFYEFINVGILNLISVFSVPSVA